MSVDWQRSNILVTGGASFIGSHLVDALVGRGAFVRVVDDLSCGKLENIEHHVSSHAVEFIQADLREPSVTRRAVDSIDLVFHLAAEHGGRGYVDLHQAGPATNMLLGGLVFWESWKAGVEKVVFASSGCVYPNWMQGDVEQELYLTEDMVKPPHDADNMYGWAKLMNELTLRSYCAEGRLKGASCRYFTVYGPRGIENHAVTAFIARAFVKQNPFEVWGDGTQVRNWTYIDDIVSGTLLAAEKIDDGSPVNLGTMERITVVDAVKEVMRYTGHNAPIKYLTTMPVGPLNRVADNSLARSLLGWEPKTAFFDGLHKTIDWYFSVKNRADIARLLSEDVLTER